MNKKTRRNVLKGLAVSVPATWVKPVVGSVVLPAHAQMSVLESLSSITISQSGSCATARPTLFYRVEIDDTLAPGGPFPVTVVGPLSDPGAPGGNYFRLRFTQETDANPNGQRLNFQYESLTSGNSSDTNSCNNPFDLVSARSKTGTGTPNGTGRTFHFTMTRGGAPGSPFITIDNFSAT